MLRGHNSIVPRLAQAERALKVLGFFAEHPLCLGLLGSTENDKHQSHHPLNLTKAVVRHPALWQAGLPTGMQKKQSQPWQQGSWHLQPSHSGKPQRLLVLLVQENVSLYQHRVLRSKVQQGFVKADRRENEPQRWDLALIPRREKEREN